MLQRFGEQLQGVILYYMITQYLDLYWISSTGKVDFQSYLFSFLLVNIS
jgi:hypothetical protein